MFHWPFTPKPTPAPVRYVVATRSESLAASVQRINLHNKLAVENALFPRERLPAVVRGKSGGEYR